MTIDCAAPRKLLPPEMEALVGQEVGVSAWHHITQDVIDGFAAATGDDQFIHIDPGRAAATPLGGTIAHGFLILSLLSKMSGEALPQIDGRRLGINYGLDHVRFVSPVRSGARVRGRYVLAGMEQRSSGQILLRHKVTVEIENSPKPALVAAWLTLEHLDG